MGIDIGPLTIRFYGLIIMLGAIAAGWLATKEAKRRGLNPELVWDGFIWVIIAGVIGACNVPERCCWRHARSF